eukprot:6652940-Prymnesium_polylepis.1
MKIVTASRKAELTVGVSRSRIPSLLGRCELDELDRSVGLYHGELSSYYYVLSPLSFSPSAPRSLVSSSVLCSTLLD